MAAQRISRIGALGHVSSARPAAANFQSVEAGLVTHKVLELAGQRFGDMTPNNVQELAWGHLCHLPESLPVLRGLLVTVVTLVARYRREFWNPAFEFIGAEVDTSGGGACDLVYRLPALNRYLIDEIKTGDPSLRLIAPTDQIRSYLDYGNYEWGEGFLGVRLCNLRRPANSSAFAADGGLISHGPSLIRLLNHREGAL